jgi:hypothetical protein
MSGLLCLQGGAEMQPGCEDMDAALLAAAPGLPERSGVLLLDDAERAVGAAPYVELDLAARMGG